MGSIGIHFVLGVSVTLFSPIWLYISIGITILLLFLIFLLIKSKNNNSTKNPKPKNQHPSKDTDAQNVLNALSKSTSSVLLAACSLADLPVTVPVNLAVSLAKTKKCLLIDLDSKRDALAKVFGVDSSNINRDLKISPIQTEFENLSIWPARYFSLLKQMNVRLILDMANKKYDHVLLYAPYLTILADRKQIAFCSKQAVIFCKDAKKTERLKLLLKTCNCKILLEA